MYGSGAWTYKAIALFHSLSWAGTETVVESRNVCLIMCHGCDAELWHRLRRKSWALLRVTKPRVYVRHDALRGPDSIAVGKNSESSGIPWL